MVWHCLKKQLFLFNAPHLPVTWRYTVKIFNSHFSKKKFDANSATRLSLFSPDFAYGIWMQFFVVNFSIIATLYHTPGTVQNLDREMKKCLIEAFKKTDEDFLQKASEAKPTWKVRP